MNFFDDYKDGVQIVLPIYVVKRSPKIKRNLEELKELLEEVNNGHPYLDKSICELEYYEKKIEMFEEKEKLKTKEITQRRQYLNKLLNKEIIETVWETMFYWNDITQFFILHNEKSILGENDFTKKGNIKATAKKRMSEYFKRYTEDFIKNNTLDSIYSLYKKGLIKDVALVFGYFKIGIKYKQKFIKEYFKRDDRILYKLKEIQVNKDKIVYPFDVSKYIYNTSNKLWVLKE